MKPEPLKDKLQEDNINYGRNDGAWVLVEDYFEKEDIKSAVEWLKLKRAKRYCPHREEEIFMVDWVDILEAFEDVTKNPNNKFKKT